MSDEPTRRSLPNEEAFPPPLPGPPPAVPDLAAVSASIERPRLAPAEASVGRSLASDRSTDEASIAAAAGDAPTLVGAPADPTVPGETGEPGDGDTERAPGDPEAPITRRAARPVVGPWALALAIVALGASFVVGWMLPLGLVAIIVAIIALRRPAERRGVAAWALVLGAVSVLYSAGWLLWAAWGLGLLG